MSITGTFIVDTTHEDGSRSVRKFKNLIVDVGLELIAGVIAGTPLATDIEYLALGDSNNAPSLGEKTLVNELRRDQATVSRPTAEMNKIEFKVVHAKGAVVGIFREAGLHDGPVPGETHSNMFNRVIFADQAVTVNDTLTEIWIITVTNKV